MAVDYTEARTVDVNDGVYSQDYNRLALAFNDRLKNGVGDPVWRMLWYAHSLVRGIRNPSNFLSTAQDEWWKVYAHIKVASGITWPTAGASEPAGVNVANPLGAFVHGLAPTVVDEEGRINGIGEFNPAGTTLATAPTGVPLVLGSPLESPQNNADYWTLSKYQRGAVPSDLSDFSAANAIKSSQEHGKINYPDSHFFLKNYGGFLPSPQLTDTDNPFCDDDVIPDYTFKFKALNTSVTDKTYNSCPPDGVMFYFEGFVAYKLIHWDGTTTSLPLNDYLEGPYEDNAILKRYKGQQLNESLNWFAMEYRANETEREESDMNRYSLGFQFQDFLTRQYCLAPAYGTVATGSITATYPTFELSGGEAAGTYLDVTTAGAYSGTTTYTVPAKFTFAAFYAKTTGSGAGDVTIEVFSGATSLTTFTITAVGGSTVDHLKWFTSAHNEADIRFKLKTVLPASVTINIECAMLLEYQPTIYDSYVCLRLGSTDGPASTSFDKSGYTFSDPKTISDNLLEYGCLKREGDVVGIPTTGEINENPVYESAKRLIQNNMRLAERQGLVGYEVIGDKSYIHFKRFARAQYSNDLDVFDGIAPPVAAVASGDLIEGEEYQVWSASDSSANKITYDGTLYPAISSIGHSGGEQAGTYFTATAIKVFTVTGDAFLRVRNGIRSIPIKDNRDDRFRGQTNEWLAQMSTAAYKLSDSSIFKSDSYADIMAFLSDRCGLMSCAWSRKPLCAGYEAQAEINNHVNYGSLISYKPENPSGYRYILDTHGPSSGTYGWVNDMIDAQNTASAGSGNINHYKSCEIYKPDYELEAVYIDPTSIASSDDYDVIVKLTGRLDVGDTVVPLTIDNTTTSWYAAFTGGYTPVRRTDENAVLEYLYHIASYNDGAISDYNCIQKVGDIAYDANASSGYDGGLFHGNCYPRFYFGKQVRHVWNDTNASYDPADSLTTVDEMLYMEYILQAISSGFIDKESTLKFSCTDDNRMYDYTFPNLCYQALRQSKSEAPSVSVTRVSDTFTWSSEAGVLYLLVGVTGGVETPIAESVTSPYTETGVPTYTSYKAYAGSNKSDAYTIIDFTMVFSGADDDNVITFTENSAEQIKYMILGRTATGDFDPVSPAPFNTNDWEYYTGSGWSSDESDAEDVSSPVTITGALAKDEYRVIAKYYGQKRWFEFLPPTLRPDNAQGFGPMPNTNLYARIFNNVCNAVNLLVRARIELPFDYRARHTAPEHRGLPVEPITSSYSSTVPSTEGYPFTYSCTNEEPPGTSVARIAVDACNAEKSVVFWSGATVTDRSLYTDVGDWTTGGTADSQYRVGLISGVAACTPPGGGNVEGMQTSGETYDDGDYYKPYVMSRKYKGELQILDDGQIKYALPVGIRDQFMDEPGFLGNESHYMRKGVIDATDGDYLYVGGIRFTEEKYRIVEKTYQFCKLYEGDVMVDAAESPLYGDFTTGDSAYDQRSPGGVNTFSGEYNLLDVLFTPYDDKLMFIKIPIISRSYPNNTY